MANSNGTENKPKAEVDFSEFLWMEHEEEYDEEVIKELEEEEMINYYYELYEESLNAEGGQVPARRTPADQDSPNQGHYNRGGPECPHTYPRASSASEDLGFDLNRLTLSSSTLNPNAAEFVPQSARLPVSANSNASEGNNGNLNKNENAGVQKDPKTSSYLPGSD